MIVESLVGSFLGGVFRLAPEVLKIMDRKYERAHEALMMDKETTLAEKRLDFQLHQGEQVLSGLELAAVSEAIHEQGETSRAAGKFVAAISALVRPIVTYWLLLLWSLVKVAVFFAAIAKGGDWMVVVPTLWGAEDTGLMSMVLTFWFVGRVYERSGASR